MGIQSKNRIEWGYSMVGCQYNSTTIATVYDTFGADASEYIVDQTEM